MRTLTATAPNSDGLRAVARARGRGLPRPRVPSDLAARSDAIEYFDMALYLCPRGTCRSSGLDGEALYFDASHTSMPASWKLGEEIQKRYDMPPPLAEAARGKQSAGSRRRRISERKAGAETRRRRVSRNRDAWSRESSPWRCGT